MSSIGDNFPEFELEDQHGKIIKSADLKGKPFVVFAYPRASTPGCTNEVCSVRDHYQEIKERGVLPLGISNDKVAKNKKFSDKHNLQYSLLCDPENKLLTALKAYGEKKLYGKISLGTHRHTWIVGQDYKIKKIFKKVQTKLHGEEILDALNELGM